MKLIVRTLSGSRYTFTSDLGGMRWERVRGEGASVTLEDAGILFRWPNPRVGERMKVSVIRAWGLPGGIISSPVVSIEREE